MAFRRTSEQGQERHPRPYPCSCAPRSGILGPLQSTPAVRSGRPWCSAVRACPPVARAAASPNFPVARAALHESSLARPARPRRPHSLRGPSRRHLLRAPNGIPFRACGARDLAAPPRRASEGPRGPALRTHGTVSRSEPAGGASDSARAENADVEDARAERGTIRVEQRGQRESLGRLRPAPQGGTPAPRNTKVAPNARQVSTGEAPEYRSEARTSRGTGGGAALALAHWFGEKPHAALAVRVVVTIEDGYRIHRKSRVRDRQAELRAERIGRREHSRSMNRASRSLYRRLGLMNGWLSGTSACGTTQRRAGLGIRSGTSPQSRVSGLRAQHARLRGGGPEPSSCAQRQIEATA